MLNCHEINEAAEHHRNRLMAEAENQRLATAVRASREAKVMFFVYMAELVAAAGAVILLKP